MLPLMGKLSRSLYIVCYSYILMYNCLKIKFNLTKSGAWTASRIEQDTSSFFLPPPFQRRTKAPRQQARWGQEFAPCCADPRKIIFTHSFSIQNPLPSIHCPILPVLEFSLLLSPLSLTFTFPAKTLTQIHTQQTRNDFLKMYF